MKAVVPACAVLLLCVAVGSAAAQGRKSEETSKQSSGVDPLVAWARTWGDTKKKGVFTCEEWKKYATRLFNEADRDHDGYVDAREFESIQKADPVLRDADLAYFDDHRRGRVSRSEFIDKPNPFFGRYDTKGTCMVTLEEIFGRLPRFP